MTLPLAVLAAGADRAPHRRARLTEEEARLRRGQEVAGGRRGSDLHLPIQPTALSEYMET